MMYLFSFLFNKYLSKYTILSTVLGARGRSRDTKITKTGELLAFRKEWF